TRAELAMRMVPVLAGSIFPMLLAWWMQRVAGRKSAMAALLVLTMAPVLIGISAEVRSYTLGFLLMSIALLVLEQAISRKSAVWMAGYTIALYGAVLSDYSIAWFVGSVGVYALLRMR